VFVGKLRDLRLSILVIQRPKSLQFIFINSIVIPFAKLQLVFDVARQRFRTSLFILRNMVPLSFSCLLLCENWHLATALRTDHDGRQL
jgi:hypothetical protein